jgi:NHLM bacteriocin system ABC transporter ATP-binding protein
MTATSETLAWLKGQLGDGCVNVPVQGDRPLLLDDPSCAYLTLSEHHQLFCVGYERGHGVGRREHMAACGPGQLLFGLEPEGREGATALVLSGVSGSVVWRVPTALLFRLAAGPDGLPKIGDLFDDWIKLLIATLPATPVPTRSREVAPGTTVDTDGSMALRANGGLAWIALRSSKSYLGLDPASVGGRVDYWPLGERAWVSGEGEGLHVFRSIDLLESTKGAGFADGFYRFVVRVVSNRRAELASLRLAGDTTSSTSEHKILSDSLERLAAIGRGEKLASAIGGTGELARTCHLIARWLGTDPPRVFKPEGRTFSNMQLALSLTTGLRTRRVVLARDWRDHDSGALLGFLNEPGDELVPVGLLPSRRGYTLHDPRASAPRRVTDRMAEELHPHAYQVYAPLPPRPLGPWDVLRFASAHTDRDLVLVAVVGSVTGLIGTLVPLLTGLVFDRIIPGAERGLLAQVTLVLLAVFGGQALFDLARGLALVRAETLMDTRLEAGVWDRLLSLPIPFFRKYSAGDLAARAAGIGGIRQVLAGATLSAMLSGVFSIWNLALLFSINVKLALAATGLVAVSGTVAAVAAYSALKHQRSVASLDGKIGGLLLQLITGIAKLRITGTENRAFSVWSSLFASRRDADFAAERISARVGVFQASFPLACSLVLWLIVGQGVGQGAGQGVGQATPRMSTGEFLAFSAAFSMFLSAMLNMIDMGLRALSAIPMYERAKPILAEHVESQGSDDVRIKLTGGIEVSHVSFRYEPHGPLILDDVSLRMRPGEFVAVVGSSGSGKSTFLRILLGFETCTEGGVFFDGQDLARLDLRVVRQQIGVVLQNSRVTAGDIYTNIVGNSGRTVDDAWAAARGAALDKDIEAMPMGMHTVISQGGATFSGGQKQRLLIARALASRPAILFFDEATSALDNVTQAAVSDSLERLRVTRVVIAHRLSTIRQADTIVVLERGRIVEKGGYDELMKRKGAFFALARRQTV